MTGRTLKPHKYRGKIPGFQKRVRAAVKKVKQEREERERKENE